MNRNGGPRFDPERRVWTVRVRTPDGRRRRVSAPTKKACAASAAALVTDVARGSYVAPQRQSFDDLAGEWLLTAEANLAAGTHARYRRDLARALRQWRDVRHGPAWSFMVATGARPGECLGLRWSDLDLDSRAASIRQAITSVDHRPHIGPTKTGKARRIDLDARTVSMLRSHRATQAEERLALGAGYGEGDFVFALPDGRHYHPDHFSRAFSRWLERSGLPACRLYDTRHTHATLLLEAGVDVKVVADRLGNSAQVVWTTYQHVRPSSGCRRPRPWPDSSSGRRGPKTDPPSQEADHAHS